MVNLNQVMQDEIKDIIVTARITQEQRKFLINKNINLSKLVREAIEEVKRGNVK